MLFVSHIKTQESLEKSIEDGFNPLSKEYIKGIHKTFYSQEGKESFLFVSNDSRTVKLVPGELRDENVQVGDHIAPLFDEVDHLLDGNGRVSRLFLDTFGPRKPLRINFNAHFVAHLFPELMPS